MSDTAMHLEVNCETGEVTETPLTVEEQFNLANPITLVASSESIPPDGATASTVTYTNKQAGAPAQVTFDVNGATATEPLTNGVASIEVASQTAGDTITITCEGLTTTVTVTGG